MSSNSTMKLELQGHAVQDEEMSEPAGVQEGSQADLASESTPRPIGNQFLTIPGLRPKSNSSDESWVPYGHGNVLHGGHPGCPAEALQRNFLEQTNWNVITTSKCPLVRTCWAQQTDYSALHDVWNSNLMVERLERAAQRYDAIKTSTPGPSRLRIHDVLFKKLCRNGVDITITAKDDMEESDEVLYTGLPTAFAISIRIIEIYDRARHTKLCEVSPFSAGLWINGELGGNYLDSKFSPISPLIHSYISWTGRANDVCNLTFVAGRKIDETDTTILSGVNGLVRCLCAQLVRHYRGKLDLSFMSLEHMDKAYEGDLRNLFWLFESLVRAVSLQGSRGTHMVKQYVNIIIDGIQFLEKDEQFADWTAFVNVLHRIAGAINEPGTEKMVVQAAGIAFKYVLIHPNVSKLHARSNEFVIYRTRG